LNSFVFAYSWYLDIISESWDALVENDYERVMPLTFDFRLNYQFIYHPYLAPQLGIFSTTPLSSDDIIRFIENIPQKFKNIEINLNKFNLIESLNLHTVKNSVFSLDLIQNYDKISSKYSFNLQKDLKEIIENKYFISKGILPSEIIDFLKTKNPDISENNYNILRKVISYTLSKRFSMVYCAYNQNNELVGLAFFVVSNYNVNLLILSCGQNEYRTKIISLLIDGFIRDHVDRSITFNIEANSFPEINEIIRGFGAKEFFYQTIIINRLPRIFRIFQRKKF
jgi:hypothetical protein